jgi:hypothetical protein
MKKFSAFFLLAFLLCSCWKNFHPQTVDPYIGMQKVWGYKAIYGNESAAKSILYTKGAHDVLNPGNIYAYKNYIFQLDAGNGIHVIDNSLPSQANRIGFITVRGCTQIAIKNDLLYTNCYDDLVVLDFSDLDKIHEYSELPAVFTEYRYASPLATPPGAGYYECPRYDSLLIGWKQDSIYAQCYKK